MNWTDAAITAGSPYLHLAGRYQRSELFRSEALENSHHSDDSFKDDEAKFDEEMNESSSAEDQYPDTHLGRMASIFSDRMPCTGMAASLPSTATEGGSFFTHDTREDTGGGDGDTATGDLTMMTIDSASSAPMAHAANQMMHPSIDMAPFDDQTSADLQQLFPSTPATGLHTSAATARAGYSMYPIAAQGTSTDSLAPDHELGGVDEAIDQFSEPYQSLPSAHSDHGDAAHMMVPFPFGGTVAHASFDEPDDLAATMQAPTAAMEMRDMATLFHHTSLMTPPTAVTIPRTTIVSPLNTFGPPRMLMPQSLRDQLGGAFDDDDDEANDATAKFSADRRKLCCVEDCTSQARAFNRCKRHGGSKRCSAPSCTKSVQSRGLCIRHGGGSRCQEDGCTRAAQSHGKCKMHGGGRPCVVPGCEKKAHLKRLCRKHGGGAKCSLPDCDKWAQRQGMCMTHSKHHLALLGSPPPSPASSSAASASPPLAPSAAVFLKETTI